MYFQEFSGQTYAMNWRLPKLRESFGLTVMIILEVALTEWIKILEDVQEKLITFLVDSPISMPLAQRVKRIDVPL